VYTPNCAVGLQRCKDAKDELVCYKVRVVPLAVMSVDLGR